VVLAVVDPIFLAIAIVILRCLLYFLIFLKYVNMKKKVVIAVVALAAVAAAVWPCCAGVCC